MMKPESKSTPALSSLTPSVALAGLKPEFLCLAVAMIGGVPEFPHTDGKRRPLAEAENLGCSTLKLNEALQNTFDQSHIDYDPIRAIPSPHAR